jgi:hypothetical protein
MKKLILVVIFLLFSSTAWATLIGESSVSIYWDTFSLQGDINITSQSIRPAYGNATDNASWDSWVTDSQSFTHAIVDSNQAGSFGAGVQINWSYEFTTISSGDVTVSFDYEMLSSVFMDSGEYANGTGEVVAWFLTLDENNTWRVKSEEQIYNSQDTRDPVWGADSISDTLNLSSFYNANEIGMLAIRQQSFAFTYDQDGGGSDPVPEPATLLLFGTGLAGLIGSKIRKKKK